MKKTVTCLFILFAVMISLASRAQDTIRINGSNLSTRYLREGEHEFLVYQKKGKDSSRAGLTIWSRKIERITYEGRKSIAISQHWDATDGVYHTAYSVNDEKTFAPLFHKFWWRGRGSGSFDFINQQAIVNDTLLTATDTARAKKTAYDAFMQTISKGDFFNWHLDLETYSTLPLKAGRVFVINFYEPGYLEATREIYSVTGSAYLLDAENNRVDCWLLTHTEGKATAVYWISKKTNEVLKMQEQNNGRYRYKIKLGFGE